MKGQGWSRAVVFGLFLLPLLFCNNAMVRDSFLVDYFSSRHISGILYGLVQSSVLLGYLIEYFFRSFKYLLYVKEYSIKALLTGSFVVTALVVSSTGFAALVLENSLFVALSCLAGALRGYTGCFLCLAFTEGARIWFPENFLPVVGVIQMGYYIGSAMGQSSGAVMYDLWGYIVPYLITGAMTIVGMVYAVFILPGKDSKCYTAENPETQPLILPQQTTANYSALQEVENADYSALQEVEMTKDTRSDSDDSNSMEEPSIYWASYLPVMASMLINIMYGYLQIMVTPYVQSCCNISISESGLLLIVLSLAMAIGSVFVGQLLKSSWISASFLMIFGSLLVAAGLFILFPPPIVQTHSVIPAYIGTILVGFGDPFLTLSCIDIMLEIQESKAGHVTAKNRTDMNFAWIVLTYGANVGSGLIGGVFRDYFAFYEGSYILISGCFLSIFIIITVRLVYGRKTKRKGSQDSEI